jgi:thymidylate synthase
VASELERVISVANLRSGYHEVLRQILEDGARVNPRGQATRELSGVTVILADPTDALPVGVGRQVNLNVAAVEACQLIAGTAWDDGVVAASSQFERYRESSGFFHGNYGRRIGNQLARTYRKLREDPDTRQAVITLWNPVLDNLPNKRDYPCTVAFQFLLRDGQLVLYSTMRSNDAFLGLAYDAFQFTQLQLTLARALGVPAGPLVHRANSLHLYEKDLPRIEIMLAAGSVADASGFLPRGFGRDGEDDAEVASLRARNVLRGIPLLGETESERWYRERLDAIRDRILAG